jgi:hypothetical protein
MGTSILPDSLRTRVTNAAGAPLAGVIVTWQADRGSVSPSTSVTDADGLAAGQWFWYSPQTGWAQAGTYNARAVAPGGRVAVFTGYARMGPAVREITLSPGSVNVSASAAQAGVSVRVTDDRRDVQVTAVSVQFYNPTATTTVFQSYVVPLARTSGTTADGTWTGTVVMPQGAEAGAWTLGRLTLSWGCGGANRRDLFDTQLKALSLPYQLFVTNGGTPSLVSSAPAPQRQLAAGSC